MKFGILIDKYLLTTIAMLMIAVSCQLEKFPDENLVAGGYTFDLSMTGGGFMSQTKANASVGWTVGEKVFVFFQPDGGSLITDKYLILTNSGNKWEQTQFPSSFEPGSIGSKGKLSAVYVPYLENEVMPKFVDNAWHIDGGDVYYSCADNVDYVVNENGKVTSTVIMTIPNGYVEFSVSLPEAESSVTLNCNLVDAYNCVSLGQDMKFRHEAAQNNIMTGHEDGGIYYFWGITNETDDDECEFCLRNGDNEETRIIPSSRLQKNHSYYLNPASIVVNEPDNIPYTGGIQVYKVESNDAWKLQYTEDGGISWIDAQANTPIDDWVSFNVVSGVASNDIIYVAGTIEATDIEAEEFTFNYNTALREASVRGSEAEPWDLSMHDIYGGVNTLGRTTANCYVISAPGWYSFPLVYGNAIKNGVDNTSAYKNTGGTLDTFVKADGNNMESPYISGVTTVYPLWEDVSEYAIISNTANDCKIVGSGEDAKVVFHISQESITQGNVVIAASNGTDILWSWHIWVTAADLTPIAVTNDNNTTLQVSPLNLGWVDDGTTIAVKDIPERTLDIRFIQINSGKVVERTVVSEGYFTRLVTSVRGSSPTWQWGRKDPFIRCDGFTNNELTSYSGSFINIIKEAVPINEAIMNPTNFYSHKSYAEWVDPSNIYNLWSASNNGTGTSSIAYSTKSTKTVYDPCPPGFQVPQGDAFSGFAIGPVERIPNIFGQCPFGLNFLTGEKLNTIFFPVSPYRNFDGILKGDGKNSHCWTAFPRGELSLGFEYIYYKFSLAYSSYGGHIRPVQE